MFIFFGFFAIAVSIIIIGYPSIHRYFHDYAIQMVFSYILSYSILIFYSTFCLNVSKIKFIFINGIIPFVSCWAAYIFLIISHDYSVWRLIKNLDFLEIIHFIFFNTFLSLYCFQWPNSKYC